MNARLPQVYVHTRDYPSVVSENVSLVNAIFNLKPYSDIVEAEFIKDLYFLADRGNTTFNASQLNALWNELYSKEIDVTNLNDYIAYYKYKIAFINSLAEANSLPINTTLENDFEAIYRALVDYKVLHINIEERINLSLHLKTI